MPQASVDLARPEEPQHGLRNAEAADDDVCGHIRPVGEDDPRCAIGLDPDGHDLVLGEVLRSALAPGGDECVADRLAAADRNRGGLERENEWEIVNEPLQAGHVVGKAAGRRRGGTHEQRSQLVTLEEVVRELAQAHELVHGLDAAVRDEQQFLERVRLTPLHRCAEPVLPEGRLPVLLELSSSCR